MSTHQHWLQTQTQQGRHLYLVLDCATQLSTRNVLIDGGDRHLYRNLYLNLPDLSDLETAPYLIRLTTPEHPAIRALLENPEGHWGWLASAATDDIDALANHWQQRAVCGEWPNQVQYRFQDNRVLGRALAFLQPDQRGSYLGLMTSVCHWHDGQWTIIDNPTPGEHKLPNTPPWLKVPPADAIDQKTLFDNARRYLAREHTDDLLYLTPYEDIDPWLRSNLALARTWRWETPEQIHFLLTSHLIDLHLLTPTVWDPLLNETPATHFDRVYREMMRCKGTRS